MKSSLKCMLIAVATLLSSCNFDHLYYETSLEALVRIDVNWEKSHVNPNGVSAFVYDAAGDLHAKTLSSDPNVIYLKLPAGSYTVILHNNDISELAGVELRGMKRLESASIYASERTDEPSFGVVGDEMLFVEEPDDVVSCTLRDVEVSAFDIEYHYYKPDLEDYQQQVAHTYSATPLHVVHLSRIIAHIDGLEYAAGAPKAILRGMSGGYSFGSETTTDGDVMEEFTVNTRVTKLDDEDEDTIYVDYNTFGMHATAPDSQHYFMDIRFPLIDGSNHDYHIDITDDIRTETTETQNLHVVEVKLDPLPEVEGGGDEPNPDDDEAYEPSLDNWLDVEVNLPM